MQLILNIILLMLWPQLNYYHYTFNLLLLILLNFDSLVIPPFTINIKDNQIFRWSSRRKNISDECKITLGITVSGIEVGCTFLSRIWPLQLTQRSSRRPETPWRRVMDMPINCFRYFMIHKLYYHHYMWISIFLFILVFYIFEINVPLNSYYHSHNHW